MPFAIVFFAISPSMITGIINGLFFGCTAGGATIAAFDPLYRMYLRFRYPSRARDFSTPAACPECGATSNVNVASFALVGDSKRWQGMIPCPNCKMTTMTIDLAETTNAA